MKVHIPTIAGCRPVVLTVYRLTNLYMNLGLVLAAASYRTAKTVHLTITQSPHNLRCVHTFLRYDSHRNLQLHRSVIEIILKCTYRQISIFLHDYKLSLPNTFGLGRLGFRVGNPELLITRTLQ